MRVTPRHREVWRLVSLGCSIREVAAILDVSPSTADNHKAILMARLGCDKVAILTRLGMEAGITNEKDRLTPEEKELSGRDMDGWN